MAKQLIGNHGLRILLLILEVYNAKPTCTKSWARNHLMLDLTFGPSFKVKRWFTGFGVLPFRCIQICIDSLMRLVYIVPKFLFV